MSKKPKIAFITGINGQNGAYLARFLLEKGYQVHGLVRPASIERLDRIDEVLSAVTLHYGDLVDSGNLIRLVSEIMPDEIYNLGAQSHVHVSFDTPDYTANVDALGVLRLLEAIRILKLEQKTRFYQASSSELYGNAQMSPQNEETPFAPCSPYAAAKLYAYWILRTYRQAYGTHASNGILFNHESPLRGTEFVTRKITGAVARHALGVIGTQDSPQPLMLGNLAAQRDWGHAADYVRGMWLMLQQDEPDDYVLATGRAQSVKWFVEKAFTQIEVELEWSGGGANETARDAKTGQVLVQVDPSLYRPAEVHHLCGDAAKARRILGWQPEISLEAMIKEMVQADIDALGSGLIN
jgi:GDPmannose 4,6-dehydratase